MALIDTHQAVKKFIASGFKEEQAEAITSIISNLDEKIATKADIVRLENKIEIEVRWLKGLGLLGIGLLIKIAFFSNL
jgi:hypothetical protein